MNRSDAFFAAAIVVLMALFMATLSEINRRPDESPESDVQSLSNPDDLSAELRRCRAVGLGDADEAHCEAVWGESRRRFFGGPARPLPPTIEKGIAAPATSNEAVSGGAR
jgi:conjugative transfer region protein TrbK